MKATMALALAATLIGTAAAQQPYWINGKLYTPAPGESVQYINGVPQVLKQGERVRYSGADTIIVGADGVSRPATPVVVSKPRAPSNATFIYGQSAGLMNNGIVPYGSNFQNISIIQGKNSTFIQGPRGQNTSIIQGKNSTFIYGPNGQNTSIINGQNSTFIYGNSGQPTIILDNNRGRWDGRFIRR